MGLPTFQVYVGGEQVGSTTGKLRVSGFGSRTARARFIGCGGLNSSMPRYHIICVESVERDVDWNMYWKLAVYKGL